MMGTSMVETKPTSELPIVASEWGPNVEDTCAGCAPQPESPGDFEQDAAVIRMPLDDRSIRMLLFVAECCARDWNGRTHPSADTPAAFEGAARDEHH